MLAENLGIDFRTIADRAGPRRAARHAGPVVRGPRARPHRGEPAEPHPRPDAHGAVEQVRLDRALHRQQERDGRRLRHPLRRHRRRLRACSRTCYKTRVYELCRWRNTRAGRELIPEGVITKPPSAELRPDQRDDQSLPPYEVLDPILEQLHRARPHRRRDHRRRPRRRRSCAASPGSSTSPSTSGARARSASAGHGQGVRQGPPPPHHQRLPLRPPPADGSHRRGYPPRRRAVPPDVAGAARAVRSTLHAAGARACGEGIRYGMPIVAAGDGDLRASHFAGWKHRHRRCTRSRLDGRPATSRRSWRRSGPTRTPSSCRTRSRSRSTCIGPARGRRSLTERVPPPPEPGDAAPAPPPLARPGSAALVVAGFLFGSTFLVVQGAVERGVGAAVPGRPLPHRRRRALAARPPPGRRRPMSSATACWPA